MLDPVTLKFRYINDFLKILLYYLFFSIVRLVVIDIQFWQKVIKRGWKIELKKYQNFSFSVETSLW